jgi:Tol biopolymer transport system component
LVQVENARTFADSERLEARSTELTQACDTVVAHGDLLETGGAILYSVGGAGVPYGIWQLPITEAALTNMQSTAVLADASQPQLNPVGNVLAYHNRQAGRTGLFGVRMGGLSVYGNAEQYGPNNQDGRDSPPSWNVTGTQIAYSRPFDSGYPRIYVTSADSNLDARDLGFGRDPAWMPGADLIVFNGPNTVGQNPGLWAMGLDASGNDRFAITENGNDQRPIWSPDGRYLVFMSIDRGGGPSWEVYRLEWETRIVALLSDRDPGKDGLPTISPDGKWVAFLSDRDGVWKLYYVSIDGGPVRLLSEIQGQPMSWLEHSLQWVR